MSKRGEIFKTVSLGKKPRTNAFDLSHEKKLAGNMGNLIPIYLQEVLPSDKFRGSTEMVIKFAPLIAPIMHRINAYIHYFFVPNRLIWDNWKDFITGGKDGLSAPEFPFMYMRETNKASFPLGGLGDYFGLPPIADVANVVASSRINSLPFRAYQLIYNEFYRDQTLTPEVPIYLGDGEEINYPELTALRKRQWEKDYFTSAQIQTQRGPDITLPTDIEYKPQGIILDNQGGPLGVSGTLDSTNGTMTVNNALQANLDNIESLNTTINDLRTSVVLQQWLEKNMRAGSRYVEQILAHFHRRVPDYRLQRPELIGGGKQTISISEVLANFESAETAQGKMAGKAVSLGNQAGFNYSADEHGYIIGILSVMPRTAYYQGIPRPFIKTDKFDFAFPEFAHIGEQIVFKQELLYNDQTTTDNLATFGYQSRYAEYKYNHDSVHGEFRTNLEFWHLGRKLSAPIALNNSFTEFSPDNRIFAIQDESTQKLWIQIYNNIQAIRPLPVYGTPIL